MKTKPSIIKTVKRKRVSHRPRKIVIKPLKWVQRKASDPLSAKGFIFRFDIEPHRHGEGCFLSYTYLNNPYGTGEILVMPSVITAKRVAHKINVFFVIKSIIPAITWNIHEDRFLTD